MSRRGMTQEEFVTGCREAHGDRYDYSQVAYKNARSKVTVVCPEHGAFTVNASSHKRGNGCKRCADALTSARRTKSQKAAIADFRKVHGDRYDYSLVKYTDGRDAVSIICPEHGVFQQKAGYHQQGAGCQQCKNEATGERLRSSQDDVIARFRAKHGDRFDYSKVRYRDATKKVVIICETHGEYEQLPHVHADGTGCPACNIDSKWLQQSDVIARFKEAHGDTYDYSRTEYKGTETKLTITCRKHGEFEQLPLEHTRGYGCWKCAVEDRFEGSANLRSVAEREVEAFVSGMGFEVTHGYLPQSDNKWTFDVVIPSIKLAVEFNGVYWHSYPRAHKGQHFHKRKNAEENGYHLITIWEDDWKYKRERMESLLRRALVGAHRLIGARMTQVAELRFADAKAFHEENHIQSFSVLVANRHYGLTLAGELVAAASFSADGTLHRYTVTEGTGIAGGLQKLVKAFRVTHGAMRITTYCDRDYFSGALYGKAGFEKTGHTLTMSYVQNDRRVRREHYMKHKLSRIFGEVDSSLTEIDACAANNIYACWNSGTERYELQP